MLVTENLKRLPKQKQKQKITILSQKVEFYKPLVMDFSWSVTVCVCQGFSSIIRQDHLEFIQVKTYSVSTKFTLIFTSSTGEPSLHLSPFSYL